MIWLSLQLVRRVAHSSINVRCFMEYPDDCPFKARWPILAASTGFTNYFANQPLPNFILYLWINSRCYCCPPEKRFRCRSTPNAASKFPEILLILLGYPPLNPMQLVEAASHFRSRILTVVTCLTQETPQSTSLSCAPFTSTITHPLHAHEIPHLPSVSNVAVLPCQHT